MPWKEDVGADVSVLEHVLQSYCLCYALLGVDIVATGAEDPWTSACRYMRGVCEMFEVFEVLKH
jgi:hypothetical protein